MTGAVIERKELATMPKTDEAYSDHTASRQGAVESVGFYQWLGSGAAKLGTLPGRSGDVCAFAGPSENPIATTRCSG